MNEPIASLSVTEASRASGWSPDRILRAARQGRIPGAALVQGRWRLDRNGWSEFQTRETRRQLARVLGSVEVAR